MYPSLALVDQSLLTDLRALTALRYLTTEYKGQRSIARAEPNASKTMNHAPQVASARVPLDQRATGLDAASLNRTTVKDLASRITGSTPGLGNGSAGMSAGKFHPRTHKTDREAAMPCAQALSTAEPFLETPPRLLRTGIHVSPSPLSLP